MLNPILISSSKFKSFAFFYRLSAEWATTHFLYGQGSEILGIHATTAPKDR